MLLPVLPLGPNATDPAGKVFVKTWNRFAVPSLLTIWVPLSTQLPSIQDRLPTRVSTATATVAGALMVKLANGSAVAPFESLAVRIHCAPVNAAGTAVRVIVRSPYCATPVRRSDCTDQSAALPASATVRPLTVSGPPPPPPTTRPAPAECDTVPAVPLTVRFEVPDGVDAEVATVNVELAPAGTGSGLKVAVAPAGSPPAASVTSPGDPATARVSTV